MTFNDYALLFAVALPVVVVVGIQAILYVAGERGTLLLPGLGRYPAIELAVNGKEPAANAAAVPAREAADEEASNDDARRLAA